MKKIIIGKAELVAFDAKLRKELQGYVDRAKKNAATAGKEPRPHDFKMEFLRPFVCDGNPLDCDVMIVGLNPASEIKNGFWDFWKPAAGGFIPKEFEIYNRGWRAGAGKKGKESKTRANLGKIESILERNGIRVLQTNLHPWPSEGWRALPAYYKEAGVSVFEFMRKFSSCKLIVAHHRYFMPGGKFAKLLPSGSLPYNHFSKLTKSPSRIAREIDGRLRANRKST